MKFHQGLVGSYSGFRAVFVREYSGNMIEVRTGSGLICIDKTHFII